MDPVPNWSGPCGLGAGHFFDWLTVVSYGIRQQVMGIQV
jgi:hypothetical protein